MSFITIMISMIPMLIQKKTNVFVPCVFIVINLLSTLYYVMLVFEERVINKHDKINLSVLAVFTVVMLTFYVASLIYLAFGDFAFYETMITVASGVSTPLCVYASVVYTINWRKKHVKTQFTNLKTDKTNKKIRIEWYHLSFTCVLYLLSFSLMLFCLLKYDKYIIYAVVLFVTSIFVHLFVAFWLAFNKNKTIVDNITIVISVIGVGIPFLVIFGLILTIVSFFRQSINMDKNTLSVI